MQTALLILGGLVLLVLGGELLVRGSVRVAERLGVSPLLIGLTLVGFGTSTPELLTSLEAAIVGSPGIAVGKVHLLLWEVPEFEHRTIADDQIPAELERLDTALARARDRLRQVAERVEAAAGKEEAAIFEAQRMLLEDPALLGGVRQYINQHFVAEAAFDLEMREWEQELLLLAHLTLGTTLFYVGELRPALRHLERTVGEHVRDDVAKRPHRASVPVARLGVSTTPSRRVNSPRSRLVSRATASTSPRRRRTR